MEGVPIVGGREEILPAAKKYQIDQILFAIPTASTRERRDILNLCKETKCKLKSLPGVYQLANGQVSLSKMKAVAVEDLLGREPIKVDLDEIFRYLKGKTILVTGGGGSIGSELCRQIAAHEPRQLVIFDIYENNAYEIEQELRRNYPGLNLAVLIGSVRDSRRINAVFEEYHPDIVYHAAAHKHVPLMEKSPNEAIKNNVAGTYKTAYAALKHGTKRFVLISTDKAVNPTNIMGASKRLCEMVVQSLDAISKTGREDLLPFLHAHREPMAEGHKVSDPGNLTADGNPWEAAFAEAAAAREPYGPVAAKSHGSRREGTQFVAVRFGNVLGSNGSVIPLFKKQIEAGGPVTVTHPDIVRYFMTIPEAVSLVLQAGTYAGGGEIFVLDMGEPVKIDTLARNLIQLSGYEPWGGHPHRLLGAAPRGEALRGEADGGGRAETDPEQTDPHREAHPLRYRDLPGTAGRTGQCQLREQQPDRGAGRTDGAHLPPIRGTPGGNRTKNLFEFLRTREWSRIVALPRPVARGTDRNRHLPERTQNGGACLFYKIKPQKQNGKRIYKISQAREKENHMWYVIQVRSGTEEKIRFQCEHRIPGEALEKCFNPLL